MVEFNGINIPQDMLQQEAMKETGAAAVVSIWDLLILLSTDEDLQRLEKEMARRDAILAREPWRKGKFVVDGVMKNGVKYGHLEPTDWSGTEFEVGQ